jgi:hypothetical protein
MSEQRGNARHPSAAGSNQFLLPKDQTPDKVKERISFLKKAIRAIDLE